MTAEEGQTVVSQTPNTPEGCSFAVGMRWSTKNRHPYSTTTPDILWDGSGIPLTFSGLAQIAKLADSPTPHFMWLLGQFFTGLTPETMPRVCGKYQTKEIEGARSVCQTGLFYQAVYTRKNEQQTLTARLHSNRQRGSTRSAEGTVWRLFQPIKPLTAA